MMNMAQSPVVVGGVGGSGTRVIAQILMDLGFYMGDDLNNANDNLWFTLLFKRPKWFLRNLNGKGSEIFKALSIFEKAMLGCQKLTYSDMKFVTNAAMETAFRGNNYLGAGRGIWPLMRVKNMLRKKHADFTKDIGWGWKEPNVHIYIEHINKHFKNMKYIHTMRLGIDMAYSNNQQQFYNWGPYYGIEVPDSSKLLPKASLNYWIKANQKVIALGEELLGDRFLIINFDEMCFNPQKDIERLISFLDIDRKGIDMDRLSKLIKIPKSIGRYNRHDLTIFTDQEINQVRNLGFEVEINR